MIRALVFGACVWIVAIAVVVAAYMVAGALQS